jgi:hypothetical protein
MQLGQDTTSTDAGTTTYYGPPDTSSMDSASNQAVSSSTDVMGNIDLGALVNSIAQGYVTVSKAIAAGTAPPNTAAHPTPGTVQQLPGGGSRVVNADGSTTITDAQGNKMTILASGQVVSGGAPLVPGIPNGTAVLIGIAALGLLYKVSKG